MLSIWSGPKFCCVGMGETEAFLCVVRSYRVSQLNNSFIFLDGKWKEIGMRKKCMRWHGIGLLIYETSFKSRYS